ncbi:unnamed protein product [Anisakis simplex]|uniref:Fibroin heavy chain-like n=1 Tax=Anisakis simplex TaxID=6269 RepID=A0A0M3K1U9_ANISI|nr:unnamed protein product [Anisakis simplex]
MFLLGSGSVACRHLKMFVKMSISLCAFLLLSFTPSTLNAYSMRNGYARPADLEGSRSGAAFGGSESTYGYGGASYTRPASVSAGGAYQPSGAYEQTGATGAGAYPSTYGNGYTDVTGLGKKKPAGFGAQTGGVGFGSAYTPSSRYPDAGTYGTGAGTAGLGYTRPAGASQPSTAGQGMPSISTDERMTLSSGAQYPSYTSESFGSGAGTATAPFGGQVGQVSHAGDSDGVGGCPEQDRASSGGCSSTGGGIQVHIPGRPADGAYDGGRRDLLATLAPFDGGYDAVRAHTTVQPLDTGCTGGDGGGQGAASLQPSVGGCPSTGAGAKHFVGDGVSTGRFGGGAAPSTYGESGYDGGSHITTAHGTGCTSNGGAVTAAGTGGAEATAGPAIGCDQQPSAGSRSRPTSGMPRAPVSSFSRTSDLGSRPAGGPAISSTFSDYGTGGYTQHRTDEPYRHDGSFARTSDGVSVYPSPSADYARNYGTGAGAYGTGANGNGYYDSAAKVKDDRYGAQVDGHVAPSVAPSYTRPAEGFGTGYTDRTAGWQAKDAYQPVKDAYQPQAASYSRPSGLTAVPTASTGDYGRATYDAGRSGYGYEASTLKTFSGHPESTPASIYQIFKAVTICTSMVVALFQTNVKYFFEFQGTGYATGYSSSYARSKK